MTKRRSRKPIRKQSASSSTRMSTRSQSNSQESIAALLPEEIIFNILIRSRVKDISRFRCVSKTWLSIISNPGFIKSHLQTPSPYRRIILDRRNQRDGITFRTFSLHKYKPLEDEQRTKLHMDIDSDSYSRFRLIGSCNGLCCILLPRGTRFVLWNPSTTKSKLLPQVVIPGSEDPRASFRSAFRFSFLYDEDSDDYRVLIFQLLFRGNKMLVVREYSLRADSWTTTNIADDDFPDLFSCSLAFERNDAYVSGRVHWMELKQCANTIFSYHLETNSWGMMMPPADPTCSVELGAYRGCLCVLQCGDIWIMKEYGVQESWTKIASYCPAKQMFDWDLTAMELGSTGFEDHFVPFLSLQQPMFRSALDSIVTHRSEQNYVNVEVTPYVESLVSPNM